MSSNIRQKPNSIIIAGAIVGICIALIAGAILINALCNKPQKIFSLDRIIYIVVNESSDRFIIQDYKTEKEVTLYLRGGLLMKILALSKHVIGLILILFSPVFGKIFVDVIYSGVNLTGEYTTMLNGSITAFLWLGVLISITGIISIYKNRKEPNI